ncbi:tetratricopeptide repeat protein [Niveibacterium umoris]|uniref:Putative TPR repeat methyltransferase n=1 Tax=Niveibacterium umoris TaxID=1193620 RepID=A0A840BG59_9RHOO|nr:tetratricopeptide repeat protein [Niveibacterium umoris]MBB4011653.1 putative TPR repeat methyltransferase [Niveibacterium umoris]
MLTETQAPATSNVSPQTMTFDEAVACAVELHRRNQFDAAESLYLRILDVAPGHPDVLHFLGVLANQRGRVGQAVELIKQAINAVPDFPDFHNNLGNILALSGRLNEAEAHYRRVLELRPESPDTLSNLSTLFRAQDRFDEAEALLQRALGIAPDHLKSLNNYGLLCDRLGRCDEAVGFYTRAISLMPSHADGHHLLGALYFTQGRLEEAARVYKHWMDSMPDHPTARHMYAACSGVDVPQRAADDYVERTFDLFADSFEQQLQQKLSYRAPELVAAAVTRELAPPAATLDILDAGCGTGLCGPLFKPWARHLTGVDLSAGMLQKASGKACYDQLIKAELTAWIAAHPDQFDVIVSADTLCYFGSLAEPIAAAAAALHAGGLLGFSVEATDVSLAPEGHRINPHGRYSHTTAHIEACLAQAGLSAVSIDSEILRTENGKPVDGFVVVASKTPD